MFKRIDREDSDDLYKNYIDSAWSYAKTYQENYNNAVENDTVFNDEKLKSKYRVFNFYFEYFHKYYDDYYY